MEASKRIVLSLPLRELWTDDGRKARKVQLVGFEALTGLLKTGAFSFVVADVGCRLNWIPKRDCYCFWANVKGRLLDPNGGWASSDGQVRYLAVEWTLENSEPVVVLEAHH